MSALAIADLVCVGLLVLADLTPGMFHHRAHAEGRETVRVDLFDKHSNRTGYAIVDPKTGIIDFYDLKSNRTGSGTITPPPQQPTQGDPRENTLPARPR